MRCRLAGLNRAAYWRALGWPNLERARAARARNRGEASILKELKGLQQCSLTALPPGAIRRRDRL
jgi:hypothetical protein